MRSRSSTEEGTTPPGRLSQHLILIGLPGAGKTTVGRHLAKILNLPFTDLDEAIQQHTGKPIPQIFEQEGERSFRQTEAEVSRIIAQTVVHQQVIAPGGGWITNAEAMAHLRPVSRIIYLRVSPTGALTRLGPELSTRPLLAKGDPVQAMQTLYDARRNAYEAAADLTIETEGLARDALLTKVVELISTTWHLNLDR